MPREIEHKVTDSGLTVIAKCIALGIPVTFTKAALGTGIAPDGIDLSTYSNLISWYDDGDISSKSYTGSTLSIAVQYYNSNVNSVVNVGELGLYATDPDLGEVLFSYTTFGQYPDKLLPIQKTPLLKTYEVAIDFSNGASVSVTINPESLLPATDAVDAPVAGKLLRLNSAGKLPASITGDAVTVGGNSPNAFAAAQHGHTNATTAASGYMSKEDKSTFDTMKGQLNQDVRNTASPTFSGLTVDGVIRKARYEE